MQNELEQMTRRLTLWPEFDRDKLLSLIRDFRISRIEEGNTPTTFKPWDLIKITKKNHGKTSDHRVYEYAQSPQWKAFVDYVFSLTIDDRMNLLGATNRMSVGLR